MPLGNKSKTVRKPVKKVKPVFSDNTQSFHNVSSQYNVVKEVEDDKRINPANVFEGFKSNKAKKKMSSKLKQ